MVKKIIKVLIFITILVLALLLRKKYYAQVPFPGQSTDEYSNSWVGLSLIKTGMPIGLSNLTGYKNHYSKYINVDRLYQAIPYDPLTLNYPWMDHPPLLGLITGGYAALNGAEVFDETNALLIRRPIIIISTISVGLLMIFCWVNVNFSLAIIAGLIYATTPLVVLSSRMVQAENAIIPCLLATMICLNLYIKNRKSEWLFLSGIFSGIATLFKLTGVVCYLYTFLYILFYYRAFNRNFFKDLIFYLLTSIPISSLFLFYGLSYGINNFLTILFSNANRLYGIGPSAIMDLIRNQRLTQLKYLSEIWITTGWITFLISLFYKNKKSIFTKSVILGITSCLIIYLFFGGLPYGWYSFPFWPLVIASLANFIYQSYITQKNTLLLFLVSIIILGDNINRVLSISDFQRFSFLWRLVIPFILFLITVKTGLKNTPKKHFISLVSFFIVLFSIYLNIRYLKLINIDFWWQNIS